MAKQTFTTGQVLTAAQMTSLQETAMGGGPATAKTANYVLVAADAGTTVAMNAAGSTTITVNTGLFAAGDTVFIQNLGAGACTVTAGTATVATAGSLILPQNDAGILYFTATGAAIFYDYIQAGAVSPLTTKGDLYGFSTLDARIPIGTNNQVLTADSAQALGLKWATPSAGGGMTLLSTTTLSGTSTTISSINQTHKHLFIVGRGLSQGGNAGYSYQLNGNTTVADYRNFQIFCTGINAEYTTANGADFGQLGTNTAYNTDGAFTMNIPRYTETEYKTLVSEFNVTLTSTDRSYYSQIRFNSTAAISSITFVAANGNHSGTIYIYGVS